MNESLYKINEINYQRDLIDINNNDIEEIPKLSLGLLLASVSRIAKNNQYDCEICEKPFKINWVAGDMNIRVNIFIVNSKTNEELKILDQKFPYNNDFKPSDPVTELHGIWDKPLEKFISEIRESLIRLCKENINSCKITIKSINDEANDKIERFSKLFE